VNQQEARLLIAQKMDEDGELLPNVKDRAKRYGWLFWHDYYSKRNEPGLPDVFLLRRGVLLVRELKSHVGRVSPDQRTFLDRFGEVALAAPGVVSVGIWRPMDLLDGTIDREMR